MGYDPPNFVYLALLSKETAAIDWPIPKYVPFIEPKEQTI
jgi:hypothetical protein